jgi:hypothetical protein
VKKLKYRIHEVISTEWFTSLSTSIKLKYCVIKRISHYSIDAPGQLLKVSTNGDASATKSIKKIKCSRQNFMDTIFKFLHSIMYTLTLQISKLTKAVVLNSFPHGRFWQFAYKENVRCTRLMQRSLQVVIRQLFVLCSLKNVVHLSFCFEET